MVSAPVGFELSELLRSADSYQNFRQGLIIANNVLRHTVIRDFDSGKNGVHNGDRMGLYFPHPNHKDDVLGLSFDLAQEHQTDSGPAMQLGVAVLAAHPFEDGNGRISRTVHSALAGKSDEEIEALGIARYHAADVQDDRARAVVDLTPPLQLNPYIEYNVYKTAGLERTAYLTELDVSEEAAEMYREAKSRLSPDSQEDLDTIFHVDWKEDVDRDMQSLEFALNALHAAGGNIAIVETRTLSTGQPRHIVDMPRTLHDLDDAGLQKLVDDAWHYRRLRAEVTLQCVAANEIAVEL